MCIGCITTTHYYYIMGSKTYIFVCHICTNSLFLYFLLQRFAWIINAIHNAIRINTTTSLFFINWLEARRQPTEWTYTNKHVDVIIVHHVNLSKTESTQSITLFWANQNQCGLPHYFGQDKNQRSPSRYFEQSKHQCRQHCKSLRCLKPNHFVTNSVSMWRECRQSFPSSNKPRLLNDQNEHAFAFSRNWTLSGVVTKEADLRFWTLVCQIGKNDNLIALYMIN